MEKLIAYYRVSTARQGASGLGIEGQKMAVQQHIATHGGTIIARFEEVESGKNSDRPELAKAMAMAKRGKAKLVIAKLDRLSRNVAFLSALMESGVEFVCCDNPTPSKLTIHILAAVAEDEAARISARTKAALAAAKARGVALGSHRPGHWDGREDARLKGAAKGNARSAQVRRVEAMAAVADLLPEIQERRQADDSLATIADALNAAGQLTTRGSEWTPMAVLRVLLRASTAA